MSAALPWVGVCRRCAQMSTYHYLVSILQASHPHQATETGATDDMPTRQPRQAIPNLVRLFDNIISHQDRDWHAGHSVFPSLVGHTPSHRGSRARKNDAVLLGILGSIFDLTTWLSAWIGKGSSAESVAPDLQGHHEEYALGIFASGRGVYGKSHFRLKDVVLDGVAITA